MHPNSAPVKLRAFHLISGAVYFKNRRLQFSELTSYTRSAVESQQSKENEQVLAVVDRLTEAGIRRDVEKLKTIYAADYFHTNADGSVMSLHDVLQSYSTATEFRFDHFQADERRVLIKEKVAIVGQMLALHGLKGSDPFTSRYRITYVLNLGSEGWKVLNSHASLLGTDAGK